MREREREREREGEREREREYIFKVIIAYTGVYEYYGKVFELLRGGVLIIFVLIC
jgi:hypothetical protein